MGVKIAKDWWKQDGTALNKKRLLHRFEQMHVTRSEDLPQLMTIEEVAKFFTRHPQTVRRWIRECHLKTITIMGRHFITPEQLAEFIEKQSYG